MRRSEDRRRRTKVRRQMTEEIGKWIEEREESKADIGDGEE